MSRIFEYFTEGIGWIRIVLSPFLIGLALGALVYFSDPNETRLIIGIVLASLGLLVGILWATRIWKSTGTMWFLSRLMATPELDVPEEDKKKDLEKPN
ncbi:MAG: hypothetical protein ACYC1Q_13070 [Bacteroidia bacterium]